ncbi:MAG TPA: hypothetical protein VI072_00570 [Polyangiaceae bacterium]
MNDISNNFESSDRRVRVRKSRALFGAATLACFAMLIACTPSGYGAEKAVVAKVHRMLAGQTGLGNPADVSCDKFTNPSPYFYTGICRIFGVHYQVNATYRDDSLTASINVGQWGQRSGTCPAVKTPNGVWAVWQEGCSVR